MSQLEERIAQFRKMAADDPDNELGHFRLGQLLMEAERYEEAAASFRRTLELYSDFSKSFQLLGECLIKLEQNTEATETLTRGYEVANARGDKMPRDAIARLLRQLGAPVPELEESVGGPVAGVGGFQCRNPNCRAGANAVQLPGPPIPDEIGQRLHAEVCAQCWDSWFRDYSIKVINELRLDLSSDFGQQEYDKYMREFFGFETS